MVLFQHYIGIRQPTTHAKNIYFQIWKVSECQCHLKSLKKEVFNENFTFNFAYFSWSLINLHGSRDDGGGIYEVPVNLQSVPVRILNQVSQGFGLSLIVAGLVMIVCAIPTTLKEKTMSKLINIISPFVAVLCLASCGSNSKSEVNVPTEYCEELVKLAEEGNAEAQYNLAKSYAVGLGVKQNSKESHKWLLKAAEQGIVEAQNILGTHLMEGDGCNANPQEAFSWF